MLEIVYIFQNCFFANICKCVYVCVFVCSPPRLLITSSVMWCDMDPIRLVDLALIHIMETNPIRVSYYCIGY